MNILVTGGAGYVGTNLIPELIKEGHNVKCLDRFFFGMDFFNSNKFEGRLELIKDDIRWFNPKILENIELVFDLAALSNDPVGELNPEKTYEINHLGRKRVATESKRAGVKQYVLASSASIYGQQDKIATEKSVVKPITAYSKANRNAEIDVLKLHDNNFCVSAFRFSSLYGISPRMRFDISVNEMVLNLFKNKKIVVRGKNNQRPFLHVKDAIDAYKLIINADPSKIGGEIFNVGSEAQNYSIGTLAEKITKSINDDCVLEFGDNNDHRSYAASFEKIRDTLNYSPSRTLEQGSLEIYDSLMSGQISDSIETITLKWYQHIQSNPELLKKHSIDGKFI